MKINVFVAVAVVTLIGAEAAKIIEVSLQAPIYKGKRRAEMSLQNLAQRAHIGVRSSFRRANNDVIETAKGVKRCRLAQTYGGYEVIGAAVEAELNQADQLTGQVFGHSVTGLDEDIPDAEACQRNIKDMLQIAARGEGIKLNDPGVERTDGRRVIWVDPDTNVATLAYEVEFFYSAPGIVTRPTYFISACDKEVILKYDQIQNMTLVDHARRQSDNCDTDPPGPTPTPGPGTCNPSVPGEGGNQKTGKRIYNQGRYCLNVQQSGSTCTMTNDYARIIDNQKGTSRTKTTPISFTCSQGYSDPVNEAYGVANDAMYFGDITGRLYVEKYSFRALPYAPRLVVHYDNCYDNAFWDGTDMYFGDGCSTFYPLVSQDVVTHELGHGITTRNSNLVYSGQPGGMNEAFSDISGEVAEVFGRGSNDWFVGNELFKGSGSLRYFVNPPDDRRSIKMFRDYYDGLDVHYSSGVYNHAFYQLVQVQGMNIYDAYKCFVDSNRFLWSRSTNMKPGACNVMQAAYDNGFAHEKVKSAFSVVGIDLTNCDFAALTTAMTAGETRKNVLVKVDRQPVIQLTVAAGAKCEAAAQDGSNVLLEFSSDNAMSTIEYSGINTVEIPAEGTIYVRLSNDSTEDVAVTLTVS